MFFIHKLFFKYEQLASPVKASIIYTFCSMLQQGISFIVIPLYTRLVSSEQFGIYSLYQSWDQVLIIFATLNMWNYLFSNGMIKYENRRDEFTSALLGLNLFITSVFLTIFFLFKNLFLSLSGLPLVVVFFLFIDFYLRPGYEYWCSRQRFDFSVKKFAIASILISVFTPLISIWAVISIINLDYDNPGVGLVLGKVFCAGVVYFIINLHILKNNFNIFNKNIWKYAIRFNLPLIPHFLSCVLLAQTDKIMIGAMVGKSEAAICGIAHSVTTVMLIVNISLMNSIVPWTYKKFKKNEFNKISTISEITLLFVAVINILAALSAPEIISILAPEEYSNAVFLVPPMIVSNVFIFMFNLYANVEYYYEKTKYVAIASCLSAILNVLLNYLVIPVYGYISAGYTTLICYIFYALFHYYFMVKVIKEFHINSNIYNNHILWLIAVLTTILSLLLVMFYPYPFMRWGLLFFSFVLFFYKKDYLVLKFRMLKE